MKARIFALSLLTAVCMASCSDSLDTDVTSTEQGELTTYKLKTAVFMPQEVMAGTRAQDQTPDDGDNKEWHVDNDKVYFALYDANGVSLNPGMVENQLSWTKDNDQNITISSLVTLRSTQKPKYLVVFVNLDKEHENFMGQNLENLLTGQTGQSHFRPGRDYLSAALGERGETFYQRPASFRNMMLERYANLTDNNGQFFMMNSSWNSDYQNDDNGHLNVRAVDISSYVYEESVFDADNATKALVYIERVVAKVNTSFHIDNDDLDVGGVVVNDDLSKPIVAIKQKKGYNNGTYGTTHTPYAPATYFVRFDGWQLNATNKSFVPLKDVGTTPAQFKHAAGNNYQSFRDGRSYWAIDQNYDYQPANYVTNQDFDHNSGWSYGSHVPQLNYYTLTNMKRLKFGDYTPSDGNSSDISDYTDYCFENTMNGEGTKHTDAVTHVLVRAQYVKHDNGNYVTVGKRPDGTYKNVYRVAKTIYEEDGLFEYVYEHLKAMYPSTVNSTEKVKLVHNNKDFYDHNDVKTHIVVEDLVGTSYTNVNGESTSVPSADVLDEHGSVKYYRGDVTELVFGEATVYTFERGICYYSIPVKHFADGHAMGDEGYYGVVRNHWYKVEITGVSTFGHPATPGVGPDPSDPDKPYDPEKPGKPNSDLPGGTNPTDPDNPGNPGNPTAPGYTDPTNPHDPTDPTTNPGNPGKPIIPEDTTDEDHNMSARIKVLPWAKMKMDAQLGGMQNWH